MDGRRWEDLRGQVGWCVGLVVLAGMASVANLGCTKKDPDSQAGVVLQKGVPAPRGLPPDGAADDHYFLDVQQVDEVVRRSEAGPVQHELRVFFALTWSGKTAASKEIDPVLVLAGGAELHPSEGALFPKALSFQPGVPETFTVTFAGVRREQDPRFRAFAGGVPVSLERALTGMAAPTKPVAVPNGFRPRAGQGWAFAAPGDWSDDPPAGKVVASMRTKTTADGLSAAVTFARERFAQGQDDLVRQNIAALEGTQQGIRVVRGPDVTIDGRTFTVLDATKAPLPGSPGWRSRQWIAAVSGQGYVLTCLGPAVVWETLAPLCEAVAVTLRVTTP